VPHADLMRMEEPPIELQPHLAQAPAMTSSEALLANCSYVATSRTALDAPAMRKWTAQRVWSRRYVRSFGRFRRYANRWSMLSDGGKENGPPKSGPFPTRNTAVLSHRRAQATSYWETLAVLREFCGCSPA